MKNNYIDKNYRITTADLLDEIKPVIKDLFIAKVRKNSDGILLRFANGQSFTLAVWENVYNQKKSSSFEEDGTEVGK